MDSADSTWPEAAAAWVVEELPPSRSSWSAHSSHTPDDGLSDRPEAADGQEVRRPVSTHDRLPPTLSEAISSATGLEIEQLLEHLASLPGLEPLASGSPSDNSMGDESRPPRAHPAARRLRLLLQQIAARALRLRLADGDGDQSPAAIVDPDLVGNLAAELAEISPEATAHCLQLLSAQGDARSLVVLCDSLKRQIIVDEAGIAVALSPLVQWPPADLASVFSQLGEAIWRWELLGAMLDLAGHGLRRRKLREHPLTGQAARLRELLSGTVGRLSRLEENPQQFGDDVATIQRVLSQAIALTVSLCDTLGLIGDQQAEGPLNQALGLSHRRVQTEAAGALARLGKPHGKQRLLELAKDPAARLRALAYADELDIEDAELAQWREPVAMAEAEVISWLADRDRFGVPPAKVELVDDRTLYWPSYDEPQNCYLFQFTYHFAQGDLTNIMIAGPLVYAFQADMRRLEVDDVYAVFAGWQAEHEDIYEVPAARFNTAQLAEVQRLLDAPAHDGIEDLKPLALTFFFGERAVLAMGTRDGQPVCTVSDGLETVTMPFDTRPTSLSPDLVLALYRGRKLLRHFNS